MSALPKEPSDSVQSPSVPPSAPSPSASPPKFQLPPHLAIPATPPPQQHAPPSAGTSAVGQLPETPVAAVAAVAAVQAPHVGTSVASVTPVKALRMPGGDSIASSSRGNNRRQLRNHVDHFVVSRKHGRSYAVLKAKGFPEVLAIGPSELNARIRGWARAQGHSLKQRELDDINEELRSEADATGLALDVYARVRPLPGGGVEVDLSDGAGTTVRLASGMVEVLEGTSDGLFIRSSTALALPIPAEHGDWMLLKRYVNLNGEAFLLYVAWITFVINSPKAEATKYVFLVIKGTQGTGKTFASKTTQSLIDPNAVNAQALPGSPRDLAIMLQSVHLLVVDNMRDLSTVISDALCIAATGGSVPMRKLYTDDEQKALYLHGAIVFNGIHPFIGQSDFADRCMVLELDPIPPGERKSEAKMLKEFEADRPVILRGLYDLIVKAQLHLPAVEVVAPTRMLDFTRWLGAVELALGLPVGQLQRRYADSLAEAQLESLLDNPLAATILAFAEDMPDGQWEGTPGDLYQALTSIAGWASQRSRPWPSSAAAMGKRLHGLQAPLFAQGISLEWTRGKDRRITVRKLAHANVPSGDPNAQPKPADVDDSGDY